MIRKVILTSLIIPALFINIANAQMSEELAEEAETVSNNTSETSDSKSELEIINSSKDRIELLRARGYVPKSEMNFPPGFKPIDNFDVSISNQIKLYIKNYAISRNMNDMVSCSMEFHVNNDSFNRISLLSYKVNWDGLNTAINMRNILPRQDKFQKYTLLGEGCYNADKVPNITVNRCRIKGMSQDDCANMIRWKKSK